MQKLKKTVVRHPSGIPKMELPGVRKVSEQERAMSLMLHALVKQKGMREDITK